MKTPSKIVAVAVACFLAGRALALPTPRQTCERGKNTLTGQYDYCRQKGEARFAATGDAASRAVALQRCHDKYIQKWSLIESLAGGTCPSTGDQAAIQGLIDATTANLAKALAGGRLDGCPDLLGACDAEPKGQLLTTGQTRCWRANGSGVSCRGTGLDGELQTGRARAYVDNGDGTITDTQTGLMWEKLAADGSIHDKNNQYSWAYTFASKLAALNDGGGFAGHTDWRVPNVNELQTLVDYGRSNPAVSAAFDTGCVPGCTVLTCSCTRSTEEISFPPFLSSTYCSSTTFQGSPNEWWAVEFHSGNTYRVSKGPPQGQIPAGSCAVRAVRGGS